MTDPLAAPSLVDIAEILQNHERRLTALEEFLAKLHDRLTAVEDAVSRGHWADQLPESLPEWVARLSDTYLLETRIGADWTTIPAVVAELDGLRRAHRAAYADKAPANARVTWHDMLTRVLTRIEAHQAEHRKAHARKSTGRAGDR